VIQRFVFTVKLIINMIIPPLYSFERLEAFCKKQLKRHPTETLPRSFLASLYQDYVKYPEARQQYEILLAQGYEKDSVLKSLGEICYRLEDFNAAVKYLEIIESRHRNDKYFNYYIGVSLMCLDQTEKALPYLLRAKQLSSKKPRLMQLLEEHRFPKSNLYAALGYCFLRAGQFANSAKFYQKALSLNPDGPNSLQMRNDAATAHIHLANGLLQEFKVAEAVEQFHLALELEPEESIVQAISRTLNELGEEVPVPKSPLH
jgi:tetratricopeptide (TPR) repeat protein